MKKRKYPMSLFVIGFITNFLFHYFWLFLSGVILIIAGIFLKPCLFAGALIILVDAVLSFAEQSRIRKAFLSDSDNADFRAFQDALSGDGKWTDNIKDVLENKVKDNNED